MTKKVISFLKNTFLGGALIVLPAWLAVLLLLKVLIKMEVIVKPVSSHLPETVDHPQTIAILVLIAICFAIGTLLHTAMGRQIKA